MMWGPVEERLLNGRLGKIITRVVGKPGSLRFRLARDTAGVTGIRALSMGLGFAQASCWRGSWACRRYG